MRCRWWAQADGHGGQQGSWGASRQGTAALHALTGSVSLRLIRDQQAPRPSAMKAGPCSRATCWCSLCTPLLNRRLPGPPNLVAARSDLRHPTPGPDLSPVLVHRAASRVSAKVTPHTKTDDQPNARVLPNCHASICLGRGGPTLIRQSSGRGPRKVPLQGARGEIL